MATITIDDFSGSLTDFPIGAQGSEYEQADSFIVDEYKKLITRPGRSLDFTSSLARAQVATSAGTKRISLFCPQKTGTSAAFTLLKIVGETIQYDNGTAMTTLKGPATTDAFSGLSGIDAETMFSFADWNDHTIITHNEPFQKPVKVYRDASGNLQLRTAGLPNVANTFTATGGSGANYVYALVVKYDYAVGDVSYTDYSAVTVKEFTNIGTATPASSPAVTVGSIPVLANAASEHYDTANLKIEVYRTTNGGTVLYRVGEVTNGTTSFSDTVSDNSLILNTLLYTEGGVVDNARPPKAKYVHGTSDFVYYANGIEVDSAGADIDPLPQRVWQSKRGDPDSVPPDFYADMEEPVVGISSAKSIPLVFCANSVYRLDGYFDDLGRGGIIPKKISDSVGAINHLSLVQSIDGVFFAGSDGFYFTDGYNIVPLSDKFRVRYKDLIDSDLKKSRVYGALDLTDQRVMWAMYKNSGEAYDDDNAQIYCLDLRKRCFTTWSSGFAGSIVETEVGTNSGATVTVSDTTGIDAGALVYRNMPTAPLKRGSFVDTVTNATEFKLNYAASNQSSKTYAFIDNEPGYAVFRNFLPTALIFANGNLQMGDVHGFTTVFDIETPQDVWIDPSGATNPADFDSLPIYYSYNGAFLDFGTTTARKYVHTILTKARPRLDINALMTLQITGENDDNDFKHDLTYIKFDRFYPWGTPSIPYGDPRLYSPVRTLIDVKRRFPAGKLRCEYKQIGFKPAFVNIYFSTIVANATIAAGSSANLFTATISGDTWPTDVFNYWMSFESDNYTANYRIVSRDSSTQITLHDPTGSMATGANKAWVIRGLIKQALINLIEYSLFFEVLGPSQTPYQGENAV